MNLRIREIAYHRNGVAGTGFYVVLFNWLDDDSDIDHNMVATVYSEDDELTWSRGCVSVLDIDELKAGNIAFGYDNSWRGDDFEPELRAAIAAQTEREDIDRAVEQILTR